MSEDSRVSLWTLINKPIVIWFLATVVVGLVSFGYDYVQNERRTEQAERKIDLEIASRLMYARIFYFPESYAISHVQGLRDEEPEVERDILLLAYEGFRMFRQALDGGSAYGAFPEFRERSLQSLIWELLTLREDSTAGPLKDALQAAIAISRQRIFWMNRQNFEPGAFRPTGESAREAILAELAEFERNYEKLRLPRWDIGIADDTLQRYSPDLNPPELGERAPG